MSGNSILIVGSIALDTIETQEARRQNVIGGSTTYAMVAAARSSSVSVVGVVGTDFPPEGWALYHRFGENLEDLKTLPGPTFRWGGRYHENWDERDTIFTELGVFENFTPELSLSNKNCSHVFLANIHPLLQRSVLDQMPDVKQVVVDTMNLWINTELSGLKTVLSRSHTLLINESEALMLGGAGNISDAVSVLQEMGPDTVVVKRGSQGAVAFRGGDRISIGAYPVKKVIDPTGAGDTFGGGFVAAQVMGQSLEEALVEGSALASLCVEGFGVEALTRASNGEIEVRKEFLRRTLKS
jgi:sugar/nucleoside kinase (ribokinase family)